MGSQQTDTDGLANLSRADMRFVSVGAGTTIASDREEWLEAKRKLRERMEQLEEGQEK